MPEAEILLVGLSSASHSGRPMQEQASHGWGQLPAVGMFKFEPGLAFGSRRRFRISEIGSHLLDGDLVVSRIYLDQYRTLLDVLVVVYVYLNHISRHARADEPRFCGIMPLLSPHRGVVKCLTGVAIRSLVPLASIAPTL
jgi:hypothetical protein